jgi:glycosyltransferase involved in cell wall biosynthesis
MTKNLDIKIAFIAPASIINGGADGVRAYNQLIKWSEVVGRKNITLFIIGNCQKEFAAKRLVFESLINQVIFVPDRKGILRDFHRLFILSQEIAKKIIGNYNLVLNINIPPVFNKILLDDKIIRIYDIHGLVEEAGLMAESFPKNILIAKILGREIRKSLLNSDILIASSKSLIDHYKYKYSLTFDKEFVVYNYPGYCFKLTKGEILTNRNEVRTRLGIYDNFPLLVYNGSIQKWQSLNLIFKTVRELVKINPHIELLVLTDKPDTFKNLSEKEIDGVLKIHVMRVDYEEVPKYLCSADLGLVIRENNSVNNTSTPTKFGEYLACGVPVLITDNLKEYADFTREKGLGFVIVNNRIIQEEITNFLKNLDTQSRFAFMDRTLTFIRQDFNWDIYKKEVINLILEHAISKQKL